MELDGAARLAEEHLSTAGEELDDSLADKGAIPGGIRYPVELIDVITLRDGQRVTIRPILPQDVTVTDAFFQSLSPKSRYNRFMRAFRNLPAILLTHLTHVDYRDHLALMAEIFVCGKEVAIGEARYVVSADGKSAEFAVSIADDWQGRGLGSLLLCRLIERARRAGVETIRAETLASNAAMMHLANKAGFSCELDNEVAGLVHLSLSFAAACHVGCSSETSDTKAIDFLTKV